MDSCAAVEKEVEKVLSKFGQINDHSQKILTDVISFIERLKESIADGK